jgi:hypothetical protein
MKPVRLTELPCILRAAGYSDLPAYRVIYTAAVNGEIPARAINRIWHADTGDLDAIARNLGLERSVTRYSADTAAPAHI